MNGRRTFITLLGVLALGLGGGQAGAASSDLFFSEYVEGSSNNKALEIYNGTGAPIDLAAGGYAVEMYFNGNSTAGLTIPLTGTRRRRRRLRARARRAPMPAILAQADQTNGSGFFNGDDAVVLVRGSTVIDVIGQIGFDPGTEWGAGSPAPPTTRCAARRTVSPGDPDGSRRLRPGASSGTATPRTRSTGSAPTPRDGGGAPVDARAAARSDAVAGSRSLADGHARPTRTARSRASTSTCV